MKKKDKIYDSPEYKQIREHLPEILKELERDKGLKQYQMPEGWNDDFERIYQAEHRKERIRNKILTGICAAVLLVIGAVHVGERLELTSVAQAYDIGKTMENGFEEGKYQYAVNGNAEEDEESNLQTVYEALKMETKAPMVWLTGITGNSKVTYAAYNKRYRTISYRILVNDTYIYVSQKKQIEETSEGIVNKKEFVQEVEVSDLNMKANIYESTQDNSMYCNLSYDNNTISIVSNMNLENYIKLIAGLEYH